MTPLLLLSTLFMAVDPIESDDWVSADETRFLALRPQVKDGSGLAFYLRSTKDGLVCFSGTYSLENRKSIQLLRLSLPNQWDFQRDAGGYGWWSLNSTYYKSDILRYGVDIEIERGRTGPTLSVVSLFGVDQNGDMTDRKISKFNADKHFVSGEILRFTTGNFPKDILENLPPGFTDRRIWTRNAKINPNSVRHTQVLEQDFVGWFAPTDSDNRVFVVLQFKSGTKWQAGRVWMHCAAIQNQSLQAVAARGDFEIFGDLEEHDDIEIECSFPRTYLGQSTKGTIEWSVASEKGGPFPPCGIRFRLPLRDRKLGVIGQAAYIDSFFYIDKDGNAERRYEDTGLFGLFRKEKVANRMGGMKKGDTVVLRARDFPAPNSPLSREEQNYLGLLSDSLPPGFEFRPSLAPATTVTAKKPTSGVDEPRLNDADAMYKEALKYGEAGETAKQIEILRRLIIASPNYAPAHNSAAWVLATTDDESLRDGKVAVSLAKIACKLTDYKKAYMLDTLAAAYAAVGEFEKAVAWQTVATSLADEKQKAEFEAHLLTFQHKQSLRLKMP